MARYTPFDEMERMFDEMERVFGGMRGSWRERAGGDVALDMHREDDGYVVVADLPGFEKDEIDLSVDGDSLHIYAVHEIEREGFSRTRRVDERVSLPGEVDRDAVSASYRNGVLEVHLPLAEGADGGHRIDID